MKWNEMKWNEMEMKWNEMKWKDITILSNIKNFKIECLYFKNLPNPENVLGNVGKL